MFFKHGNIKILGLTGTEFLSICKRIKRNAFLVSFFGIFDIISIKIFQSQIFELKMTKKNTLTKSALLDIFDIFA